MVGLRQPQSIPPPEPGWNVTSKGRPEEEQDLLMHMMAGLKREKPRWQCKQLITLQYGVFHLRDIREAKHL